jgi:AbrB family looped-hinge helix DNA binding protein
MYAKISKKGQVTIPKPIRKKLNLEHDGGILFIVEDKEVKIRGIPAAQVEQLAGSLKKYARTYAPLDSIRKKIKGKIADEAAREGLSD